MANNERVKNDKLPEPSFLEQANVFIDKKFEDAKLIEDPQFGPGLSIFDHKILAGVMELQVNHVNDILVEKYTSQISETYTQLTRVLNEIKDDQKINFKKINTRLSKAEKMAKIALEKANAVESMFTEVHERIDKRKDDIAELRTDFEVNKKELEEIALHKPTLKTLQNAFNFWKWKNWWKITGILGGLLVLFFFIFVGFLAYMKWKGYIVQEINLRPKNYDQTITNKYEPAEKFHTIDISKSIRK